MHLCHYVLTENEHEMYRHVFFIVCFQKVCVDKLFEDPTLQIPHIKIQQKETSKYNVCIVVICEKLMH